jgi:hypothetical protein
VSEVEGSDDGRWSRRHPPVTRGSLFEEEQSLREEDEREREELLAEVAECEASDDPDNQMWGRHLRYVHDLPVTQLEKDIRELLAKTRKNPRPTSPPGRVSL